MNKSVDLSSFQISSRAGATDSSLLSEQSYAPSHEVTPSAAPNESLDGCEQAVPRFAPVDELLKVEHWRPAEPQYCKEIAAHYHQGKRTIQKWFVDLKDIAPWFTEFELRLADDRYTPLAVELLGYRYFAGSKKKWAVELASRYADRIEAWKSTASAPAIRPDVLPQVQMSGNDNRPGGLLIHLGANPCLPAVPGIVGSSGDVAYLAQMQQRLAKFESVQQQAIAQMQEQFQQAQALNAQYQEALSLSDQLLLQEFQLKGVQLGYQALALKQQAFKATVQSAETGALPVLGKSQGTSEPPQSA